MTAPIPTIDDLSRELVGLVKSVPEFAESSYSIFSLEDLEARATADMPVLPVSGVGYDGAQPVGKDGTPVAVNAGAVTMVEIQFLIIIAIAYRSAGQDDTKPQATNLLDQIRAKVLGYKGVNTRPWRWIGERPEPEASTDGVAFYSQVWRTSVPVKGTFNNLQ